MVFNIANTSLRAARDECLRHLTDQMARCSDEAGVALELDGQLVNSDAQFGFAPFVIAKGSDVPAVSLEGVFSLTASTPAENARRLLRALQLTKPVLLEGSPGVGKTSLVAALARASGHRLTRINLSDQTAIKAGHWVVLGTR
ncbi:midasin-like [Pollicipes pollicipes]|uniref:midasin-like n=1 Tax=Pollicipes pollicipes TaxID=41117 RepID=UPI001884F17D|nr:midasin-like [Pollicipes pollicipes]